MLESCGYRCMKQPKNEVRNKTIHYILVYFICLLLAVSVWLVVAYNEHKEEAEEKETTETADLLYDMSCSI